MSNIHRAIQELKSKREKLAAEVLKINSAIETLSTLNGAVPEAEPTEVRPRRRYVRHPLTGFKQERKVKAYRYVHGNISYYDVAVNLIRKAGRPVSTYEIYRELVRLTGKNLPKTKTLNRIYGGLYLKMDRVHPIEGEKSVAWNVKTAAELENVAEVRSVDPKGV